MTDESRSDLPFDSSDPEERALWAALKNLHHEPPSADLRRNFYQALDEAGRESWPVRLGTLLGFGSNSGWLTAAASLLIGFGIATVLGPFGTGSALTEDTDRLETLERSVVVLNRQLILDRLEDSDVGTRLRGVFDARDAATSDELIARALMMRATADRVPSVRSAAIDVLGGSLQTDDVGDQLMRLLEDVESPTVQRALVDIVLRNGSREQIERLRSLAEGGRLHPDLVGHVLNSLGSNRA